MVQKERELDEYVFQASLRSLKVLSGSKILFQEKLSERILKEMRRKQEWRRGPCQKIELAKTHAPFKRHRLVASPSSSALFTQNQKLV